MNKEKVRELVNALQSNADLDCYDRETYYEVVDRWLKQNPITPQVVGLSTNGTGQSNSPTSWVSSKSSPHRDTSHQS